MLPNTEICSACAVSSREDRPLVPPNPLSGLRESEVWRRPPFIQPESCSAIDSTPCSRRVRRMVSVSSKVVSVSFFLYGIRPRKEASRSAMPTVSSKKV